MVWKMGFQDLPGGGKTKSQPGQIVSLVHNVERKLVKHNIT